MLVEKRQIVYWFLSLLVIFAFCVFMYQSPKSFDVEVGPHQTYLWLMDQSVILGDGETQLYLKSETGNFTIYDEADLYVTSGQPLELLAGETQQAFVADFKLEKGKVYRLSDNSAKVFTLTPTKLHFQSPRYFYLVVGSVCLFLLLISFLIIS